MSVYIALTIYLLVLPVQSFWIDEDGYIRGYYQQNNSEVFSQIAELKTVSFLSTEIFDLSAEILNYLKSMKVIMVLFGNVKKIYLKPSIEEVVIFYAKTEYISIDPEGVYVTHSLIVHDCLLANLPYNLNRLKKLKEIDLRNNKLEIVNMNVFNNFENLTYLSLAYNNIIVLTSSSPINLPNLRKLYLFQNQLSELDICDWNLPALEELRIHENKLSYVVNILKQFVKLKFLGMEGNSFHCDWQKNFLDDISRTRINLTQPLSDCDINAVITPPPRCFSDIVSGIPFLIGQIKAKSAKVEQQLNSIKVEFNQATRQLENQQHLMDDLRESFYRFVVEAQDNKMKDLS